MPDGNISLLPDALNLIPDFFFLVAQTPFILHAPPGQYRRIYGLDLPTPSVTRGMRGAEAGASTPRKSPPCARMPGIFILGTHRGERGLPTNNTISTTTGIIPYATVTAYQRYCSILGIQCRAIVTGDHSKIGPNVVSENREI